VPAITRLAIERHTSRALLEPQDMDPSVDRRKDGLSAVTRQPSSTKFSVTTLHACTTNAPRNHLSERLKDHGVTVKLAALVAVPPAVAIVIFPVTAPVGTVAVTCVSEFTVNAVALTPPKMTLAV
jgi:hypothetical protein